MDDGRPDPTAPIVTDQPAARNGLDRTADAEPDADCRELAAQHGDARKQSPIVPVAGRTTRSMQPWRLAELNYGDVKAQPPFEVAVLPLGATEPHNLHLPYGTDTFQVEVDRRPGLRRGPRAGGAGRAAAGPALRDRDQPDAVPAGHEPQPDDRRAGDHRPGRLAGDARRSASACSSTATAATT